LQGDRDAARAALGDVLDDAVADDCAGVFLLEPRVPLAQLLELLPDATRSRPGVQTVLARIESWLAAARAAAPAARSVSEAVSGSASKSASGSAAQPACGAPDALQVLSPREREVLARIAAGDSNKLIARALDLSLHTVKRHVANILDKLTLSTRGQAAAWYRQNS
jgi:LuxR family maltose regulon positive regulatory protein